MVFVSYLLSLYKTKLLRFLVGSLFHVILYSKFPLSCDFFFLLYSGNSELFCPAELTAFAKQP